jgi:hypothetical protein
MADDPKESGEQAQTSSPTDPAKDGSEALVLDWLGLTVELEKTQMLLIGLAQLR